MHPIVLPDPAPAGPLAFRDAEGAAAWLARQPLAQPVQMQAALQQAVAAVDASDLPPAHRVVVLDRLRGALVPAQSALEPRFSRKPLPLGDGERETFLAACRLWRSLAVAYLRAVPGLSPGEAVVPLHRAAVALRAEHYAHILAAWQVPAGLLDLLGATFSAAEALGMDQAPVNDPDYRHIAESHVSGHAAWTLLLHFIDPYSLSLAQLAVANRAFSRWRELASFKPRPDDSPRARDLPLAALLGGRWQGRWLDVRPVARKIRGRIEALEAGEGPESLRLGRELSAAACIRLLRQMDAALQPGRAAASEESGPLSLVFGAEEIYALFTGKRLGPAGGQPAPRLVDHNRIAVFGFDNLVTPAAAGKKVDVLRESWQPVEGGQISRALDGGTRLVSPSLAASPGESGSAPRLGVLGGLQVAPGGRLLARVCWYPEAVRAFFIPTAEVGGAGGRAPAFLLGAGGSLSLAIPPSAAARPGSCLVLQGDGQVPVVLGEVLERGSDFVRFAVLPQ